MNNRNPKAKCGVSFNSAGAQRVRASLSDDFSYYSLIRQAIISLKDRGGSSRQAINKVVKASKEASGGIFKSGVFNKALSTAIQNGSLTQKNSSKGSYKLNKELERELERSKLEQKRKQLVKEKEKQDDERESLLIAKQMAQGREERSKKRLSIEQHKKHGEAARGKQARGKQALMSPGRKLSRRNQGSKEGGNSKDAEDSKPGSGSDAVKVGTRFMDEGREWVVSEAAHLVKGDSESAAGAMCVSYHLADAGDAAAGGGVAAAAAAAAAAGGGAAAAAAPPPPADPPAAAPLTAAASTTHYYSLSPSLLLPLQILRRVSSLHWRRW
jgi:histone H1/5